MRPPSSQAEREADRVAELMRRPDYWTPNGAALRAEAEGLLRKNFGPPSGAPSEDRLREMQRDPRYRDPSKRDPEFVRQVDAGWRALYPDPLPGTHRGGRVE